VVGGLVVQVGDTVYDASVSGVLTSLKNRLASEHPNRRGPEIP
jgi:F0F1-type ATP synthase delta subunit